MANPSRLTRSVLAEETIINKIYLIRGKKVMLDKDLAELYGVETKVLKQAVKRNAERFPKDFMFVLSSKEFEHLRSQIVTSNWGGTRY
ncbi:MAG TPA: ORF6N domain-containing protein, partial [Chitinophagaceae bacterium]|nr:ORF6N domain-containing protein [Chitinophagaceae bacterium]